MQLQDNYFAAYRSLKLTRDANGVLVVEFHSNGGPFTFSAQDHTEFVDAFYRIAQDRENKIVILTGAGGEFIPGIFTTWSYRAGAARAEAFLLNPQPLTSRTAQEWGVVVEVVPNGKALSRARELAELYLKAPEVTRRNTRVHFIQPLKERIVREVGYGLSLEGASAADLVKSMQVKSEPVAQSPLSEGQSQPAAASQPVCQRRSEDQRKCL
jgi:enoyl-CoA hydratase/carnithine racemase